jgi:hypothetical protein
VTIDLNRWHHAVHLAYGLDDALARLEAWGLVRGSCQGRGRSIVNTSETGSGNVDVVSG